MPSLYSRLLLPRLIDCACSLGVVSRQRARVVPRAHVLPIGLMETTGEITARYLPGLGLQGGDLFHAGHNRQPEGALRSVPPVSVPLDGIRNTE